MGKVLFTIIVVLCIVINLVAFIAEKVMKKRMSKLAKQNRSEEN